MKVDIDIETTPVRLREIAHQLEKNCKDYQDKAFGNAVPCRTCVGMAEELRELSNQMQLREAAGRK
jgi:hypothetical protein